MCHTDLIEGHVCKHSHSAFCTSCLSHPFLPPWPPCSVWWQRSWAERSRPAVVTRPSVPLSRGPWRRLALLPLVWRGTQAQQTGGIHRGTGSPRYREGQGVPDIERGRESRISIIKPAAYLRAVSDDVPPPASPLNMSGRPPLPPRWSSAAASR